MFALAAGVCLMGCEGASTTSTVITRDSAGIAIHDHGRIDLAAVPEWRLEPTAELSVGAVGGEAAYQFNRIEDVRRLVDGGVAVLDASRTLRRYDSDGSHLWTAGGRGDGPGEFRAPYVVREVPPDSLLVWDARPNRLSLFDRDGRFARAATVSDLVGNAAGWGMAGPRSLLIEFRRVERTTLEGRPAMVHPSDLYLIDLDARVVRELGRRVYSTNYQEVDEGGAWSPAIFASSAAIAPAPDGLWFGDPARAELRHEVGPGEPRRIVRWESTGRSVAEADVQALLATWRTDYEDDPDGLRFLKAYGDTHPRAETFPAYERILTDGLGRLWVQDFVIAHEDDGQRRWRVFAPDGSRVLARLTHAAAFEPYDFGDGWVLGVETDDMDVEFVRLYRFGDS